MATLIVLEYKWLASSHTPIVHCEANCLTGMHIINGEKSYAYKSIRKWNEHTKIKTYNENMSKRLSWTCGHGQHNLDKHDHILPHLIARCSYQSLLLELCDLDCNWFQIFDLLPTNQSIREPFPLHKKFLNTTSWLTHSWCFFNEDLFYFWHLKYLALTQRPTLILEFFQCVPTLVICFLPKFQHSLGKTKNTILV